MPKPARDHRVEVYKRPDGLYDWRLLASNGQIIATSGTQGYTERNDAVEGWLRAKDAAEFTLDIAWG